MLDEMYEMETQPNKPDISITVEQGMAVIDADGKKIGTVKHFQPPSTSAYPDLSEFPPSLRNTSLPDELVLRFLTSGFMCVDAGFLAKDRFVFLTQVDHFTDDEVYLHVYADDLLKA